MSLLPAPLPFQRSPIAEVQVLRSLERLGQRFRASTIRSLSHVLTREPRPERFQGQNPCRRRLDDKAPCPAFTFDKTGLETTAYAFATDQFGTQLDPPAHWHQCFPAIDELPATLALRKLAVISIADKVAVDRNYHLTAADIRAWERANGMIPSGSVVMVRSDWSKRWPTRRESNHSADQLRSLDGRGPMKRMWTIIGVVDVPGSFKWYQSLLGLPETVPAHPDFGQIVDSDGTVLLCLHEWGAHEHPSLTSPDLAQPGNGLLLFLRVDDLDMALPRARALVARLEEEPHVNPSTGTMEFSLRDPDGYYVTISALAAA